MGGDISSLALIRCDIVLNVSTYNNKYINVLPFSQWGLQKFEQFSPRVWKLSCDRGSAFFFKLWNMFIGFGITATIETMNILMSGFYLFNVKVMLDIDFHKNQDNPVLISFLSSLSF